MNSALGRNPAPSSARGPRLCTGLHRAAANCNQTAQLASSPESGAAYALAIGSKLRRDAMCTFVTYRDGRPVGIQPVTVRTTGSLSVADYFGLDLEPE